MLTKTITIEDCEITFAATPVSKLAAMTKVNTDIDSEAGVQSLCRAMWWGIKRATPDTDITPEWLEMNLDVNNITAVVMIFNELNSPQATGVATDQPASNPA